MNDWNLPLFYHWNEEAKLRFRYTDADGQPMPGSVDVSFLAPFHDVFEQHDVALEDGWVTLSFPGGSYEYCVRYDGKVILGGLLQRVSP